MSKDDCQSNRHPRRCSVDSPVARRDDSPIRCFHHPRLAAPQLPYSVECSALTDDLESTVAPRELMVERMVWKLAPMAARPVG